MLTITSRSVKIFQKIVSLGRENQVWVLEIQTYYKAGKMES